MVESCQTECGYIKLLIKGIGIYPENLLNPGYTITVYILTLSRGVSRISEKGVYMYKCVGFRFADFISFFLNIP